MVVVSEIDLKSVLKHERISADNIVKGGGKSTMSRTVFPPSMAQQSLVDQSFLIIKVLSLHSFRHTKPGITPPDDLSARRREHYLTIHNIHGRQTSMPTVEFETTIPAG